MRWRLMRAGQVQVEQYDEAVKIYIYIYIYIYRGIERG
jgi:hypothetical protein